MGELVARIRTALRHRLQQEGAPAVFTNGDLTVDLTRRLVTARGQEVKLSNKEWDILKLLVVHAGRQLQLHSPCSTVLFLQDVCARRILERRMLGATQGRRRAS
jgi:DNA-binding response OmpR family regulator